MGAQDVVKRHRFGAKPADADAADERLRQIHDLSKPAPAPAGMREISKFEREMLVEALTQIDAAGKKQKAAEQALADHLAKPSVSSAVSYRGIVSRRDAAGDLKTLDLVPSNADAVAYRVNVVGRDAASNLRSFDLIPVERAAT
jgi:hypothetical protein